VERDERSKFVSGVKMRRTTEKASMMFMTIIWFLKPSAAWLK
jgi:hypothetical protein